MGFKIACFILSLAVFAHGFPLGDEYHMGGGPDNHPTFDSGHSRPDCVYYGSREFESDELGEFGSGPLDSRELGANALEPIRFAPPCPADLDGHEGFGPRPKPDFSPEHLVPEASDPNRFEPVEFGDKHNGPDGYGPNNVDPEEFGPRYVVSEGFGSQHIEPEDFRAKFVGQEEFKPQYVGPKNNEHEGVKPELIRPEGIEGIGTWHVDPEGFQPEHFEPERLRPKEFGFEQFDHFVRSRAGDVRHDEFRPDPPGTDNIEHRHFDISHFIPRIG